MCVCVFDFYCLFVTMSLPICIMGLWSRGMMLALGARGREFDSPKAPGSFLNQFSVPFLFGIGLGVN